ncbi:MAG: hypothetical protein JWR69_3171, partial [Pedosphaera sp.]|nr:hypothetical protein [Pedosphaera sp.]
IWLGVAALGLGTVAMAITLAPTLAGKAFFAASGALICSGVVAYHATSNEFTGKAVYHEWVGLGSTSEPVTRESSPVKFRQATNLLWGVSGLCLMIAAAGFLFYRAFDAVDYE